MEKRDVNVPTTPPAVSLPAKSRASTLAVWVRKLQKFNRQLLSRPAEASGIMEQTETFLLNPVRILIQIP